MTKQESKVIKGVAILMMLFHHLFGFQSWYINGNMYQSLFIWNGIPIEQYLADFSRICIAMYLFCTGYGFFIQSEGKTSEGLIVLMFHHLKKFMIEYWKIFIIVIPLHIVLVKPDVSFEMLFTCFLGYTTGFNPTWWFVRAYIFILFVLPFWIYIFKRRNNLYFDILFVVLISIFFTHIYTQIIQLPIMGNLKNVLYANISDVMKENLSPALMGIICAKYSLFERLQEKYSKLKKYGRVGICLILLFNMMFLRYLASNRVDYDYLLVTIFIFCVLQMTRKSKVLEIMGRYSLEMWLLHYFLLVLWGNTQNIFFIVKYSIVVYLSFVGINFLLAYGLRIFYKFIFAIAKRGKAYLK